MYGIPEPTQGAELSVSLCLSLTHARAYTCTHAHTGTRTHTHTLCTHSPLPPPSDVCFSLLLPTRHLVFLPSLSLCLPLLPICPWQRNKEPSKPGVEVKLLTVAIDIRRERESKSLQHCVQRYTGAKYRFWGKIPVRLSVPVPSPIHKYLCVSAVQSSSGAGRSARAANVHVGGIETDVLRQLAPLLPQ